MTKTNNLLTQPIHRASLVKPILLGAGIALILILIFLMPIRNPNPAWGKFWMVRPLIVVPLAGAVGGAFYYFINRLVNQGGWVRLGVILLSLLVYIFGLWIGTVLGLAGTLWN